MIKEMIASKEYQKSIQQGENEFLKEIYELYEAVLERFFNLNCKDDQNICPIFRVENSFPINHHVINTKNKIFI
jgi:hypothetical protein